MKYLNRDYWSSREEVDWFSLVIITKTTQITFLTK